MLTMHPDQSPEQVGHQPRAAVAGGFALLSAIFLLVVLAALGGFMMHFSTIQHSSSAQDLNGSRAYQAARAGMEWAVYQVIHDPTAIPCDGVTISTLGPLAGSLANFAVNVTCKKDVATEGVTPREFYQIVSTASLGTSGSPNYVERQIQGLIER